MKLEDFDYPLPKELIAQEPIQPRDHSKLLVVDRKTGSLTNRHFFDLVEYLEPGDVLVWNDTKVFPARILGRKKGTGGKVDLLLLEPKDRRWRCLLQPALKEHQVIEFNGGACQAIFTGRDADGISLVEFPEGVDVRAFAQKHGTMPLPPYIKREAADLDKCRYQTVYAEKDGAVAAPTAGLHFTDQLIDKIKKEKGIEILSVTLHVGYGTFKPVDDLENHQMHSERFELTRETADRINLAKAEKRKVWAIGTTALRVLETCVVKKLLLPGKGETNLYITEPFKFEIVDHLVTNFHLPKTTLLLLISAFMGEALRKKTYACAIEEKYRFYSYGDAMLII